jgi:hypothetical protein
MIAATEFEQIMTALFACATKCSGANGKHFSVDLESVYRILRSHSDKTIKCQFNWEEFGMTIDSTKSKE